MKEAFICDAIRTPIGRYAGSLSSIRTDDLATLPIKAIMSRNPDVAWQQCDDVLLGCANQAGEDNRNVARMAALLAGLPEEVGGVTMNRLCGSGMDAVGTAARAIKCEEAELMIAGGVESMSRAPLIVAKAKAAFSREAQMADSTIGWRFVNAHMRDTFGIDSMPETAENLARERHISRDDQDRFALRSQQRTQSAISAGRLAEEIIAVSVPQHRGAALLVDTDEHPRANSTLDKLAQLRPIVTADGTVTAGNASGINDGACALLLASERAIRQQQLEPKARVLGMVTAGVAPRIMGIGPVPATRKLLQKLGLRLDDLSVIELNEAFSAQTLAVSRDLGLDDNDERINPNGGAIALGHPLGMSGARLLTTATYELQRTHGHYALCTMCIGVGQGIAIVIERV
ncbi:MAG TPA: 3-oxoadipyl-CoA thiolase [Gammaproteobacteria bacterium]|nr:3-oxoadipyl-CoA thiolase [Gammaproteobacteria bacterium]